MKNLIKEITVFTNGDSEKISTWSNIPYFFIKSIENKGIKVNKVNLNPSKLINKIYNISIFKLIKLIYPNTTFNYFRSIIHFIYVKLKISKNLKKYPNSDFCVFFTFSFSSIKSKKIFCVQLCDWTYEHYINYFEEKKPDFFEQLAIKREDKEILNSNLVLSLFPGIGEYMSKRYNSNRIYYLGNVINSIREINDNKLINLKLTSTSLLFVGDRKYYKGALMLIKAFKILKKEYPLLRLDIIGMTIDDFTDLPDNVYCYGYLDKGNKEECEIYYKLLENAKIFINTTPKWGAFSACIEAMHFFTPIIVSPYSEFLKTFGKDINFGYYCDYMSLSELCNNINNIIKNDNYISLCKNANKSVEDFKWDLYVEKVIELTEEKIKQN